MERRTEHGKDKSAPYMSPSFWREGSRLQTRWPRTVGAATPEVQRVRRGPRRGSFGSIRSSLVDRRGEVALMQAVLDDAIQCFRAHYWLSPRDRPREAREATTWLFCDDVHWPFSFVNICTVVGVDPAYLRRKLMQEQARALLGALQRRRDGADSGPPPPEAA